MLFLPAVLAAQAPDAPTLEQILAKHFEAMGGPNKLASVKTVRITAAISQPPILKSTVFESGQPGFTCRYDKVELGAKLFREDIFVTTPKGGWVSDSGWNGGKPIEFDVEGRKKYAIQHAKNLIFSHVGSSPFVGYKANGLKVEYLGLEDHAEGKAHKVALEYPSEGIALIYFLDSQSFLPVKVETKYSGYKTKYPIFAFDDYKKVGGINVPHAWAEFTPGAEGTSGRPDLPPSQIQATVQKIEINPKVSDSSFLPRAAAASDF
jgi:hypothetical protein